VRERVYALLLIGSRHRICGRAGVEVRLLQQARGRATSRSPTPCSSSRQAPRDRVDANGQGCYWSAQGTGGRDQAVVLHLTSRIPAIFPAKAGPLTESRRPTRLCPVRASHPRPELRARNGIRRAAETGSGDRDGGNCVADGREARKEPPFGRSTDRSAPPGRTNGG